MTAAGSISIGNLSERLEVPKTSDELQRLSETLNWMLTRLDASVGRMSQLTADASHELRAPVSLIRTTAELPVQCGRTNTEYHEDMAHILAEAEWTTRLIDNLLLLARADAGEGGPQHELTDVSMSLREDMERRKPAPCRSKVVTNPFRNVSVRLQGAKPFRWCVCSVLNSWDGGNVEVDWTHKFTTHLVHAHSHGQNRSIGKSSGCSRNFEDRMPRIPVARRCQCRRRRPPGQ